MRRSSRRRSRSRSRTRAGQPPPAQGSAKMQVDKPVGPGDNPQFDRYDRGAEDRLLRPGQAGGLAWPHSTGKVGLLDVVVTGSFHILGVNFARFEAARENGAAGFFVRAVVDDLLSEVGSGVRREDVSVRITPGTIDNILLHYPMEPLTTANAQQPRVYATEDEAASALRSDPSIMNPPMLMNARWRMKVEYCIRTTDVRRQEVIARALFNAFADPTPSFEMARETRRVYQRLLDPDYAGDGTDITFVRAPTTGEEGAAARPKQHAPPPPMAAQALSPHSRHSPMPFRQPGSIPSPPMATVASPPILPPPTQTLDNALSPQLAVSPTPPPVDPYHATLQRDFALSRLEAEVRRERDRLALTLQKCAPMHSQTPPRPADSVRVSPERMSGASSRTF